MLRLTTAIAATPGAAILMPPAATKAVAAGFSRPADVRLKADATAAEYQTSR